MIDLNNIIYMQNFEHLSQNEMVEILYFMQDELKMYKIQKDNDIINLETALNIVNVKYKECKKQLDKQIEVNEKYSKHLFKKLTLKERLFGKINIEQEK